MTKKDCNLQNKMNKKEEILELYRKYDLEKEAREILEDFVNEQPK